MASVEKSIDVQVPVRTAYDQWTQFESFPQFMEGVEQVKQLDDKRLSWRANISGKTEEVAGGDCRAGPGPGHRVAKHHRRRERWPGDVRASGRECHEGDRAHGLRPQGIVESVGDKLGFVAPGRGRSGPLQAVHRKPGSGDRRLARRDPRRPSGAREQRFQLAVLRRRHCHQTILTPPAIEVDRGWAWFARASQRDPFSARGPMAKPECCLAPLPPRPVGARPLTARPTTARRHRAVRWAQRG